MLTIENAVAGKRYVSSSPRRSPVFNPATGEQTAELPLSTLDEINAAVASAKKAQPARGNTPPLKRARILFKFRELLEKHADELARAISSEHGKVHDDALGELARGIDCVEYACGIPELLKGEFSRNAGPSIDTYSDRQPLGVVAGIAPWNYPLNMATWKLGPALAAGNTFILKPSELTPLTALRLAELAEGIFPAGVFNVVCGQGETAGDRLVTHPEVAMLSLTGDVGTGKLIARNAADSLKRVHLELGGKAPVVVFDDADLDAVVATLTEAGYYNSGQDCTAPCRVVAAPGRYEDLVAALGSSAGALVTGDPFDPATAVGPVVSAEQQARVAAMVERAVADGAELVTGGSALDRPGYFYAPTVLAGVTADADLLAEEIFGPVAPITTFATDDEAIAAANDTEYGLVSYIFTQDIDRAFRVIERLETGMIGFNQGMVSNAGAPFGGVKQSGFGREGGPEGLDEYLETKYIAMNVGVAPARL